LTQTRILHRTKGRFAFLECARLGHRIAAQIWFKMMSNFNHHRRKMRSDLVCGPAITSAYDLLIGAKACLKERFGLSASRYCRHSTEPIQTASKLINRYVHQRRNDEVTADVQQ